MFCSTKGVCELPVVTQRISDGLADELTVLLQGVECILDCLVNGFLDGATHLLNLVYTATWLRPRTTNYNVHPSETLYTIYFLITIFIIIGMEGVET